MIKIISTMELLLDLKIIFTLFEKIIIDPLKIIILDFIGWKTSLFLIIFIITMLFFDMNSFEGSIIGSLSISFIITLILVVILNIINHFEMVIYAIFKDYLNLIIIPIVIFSVSYCKYKKLKKIKKVIN